MLGGMYGGKRKKVIVIGYSLLDLGIAD